MWYVSDVILGQEPIGEQVRAWRTNMGLTVSEACRRAGVIEVVWRRIENGDTPFPRWDTIVRMFAGMHSQIDVTVASRPQPQQQHQQQLPLPTPAPRPRRERLHADA